MKRGRGRPPGAKNKPKDTVNEFLPSRVTGTLDERVDRLLMTVPDEPEAVDIKEWARTVLADPEYRLSVETRAKAGRLLPVEMRLLVEWGRQAPPEVKRPSQWKTMLEAATKYEVQMIANISRRAMGQPESLTWTRGQTRGRTNAEIIDGII